MMSAGAAQFSTNIALSEQTKLALEQKYGVKLLSEFLKEQNLYGGNHEALTESEARTLLGAGSLDAARNRIAKARQRGKSSTQHGVLPQTRNQTTEVSNTKPATRLNPVVSIVIPVNESNWSVNINIRHIPTFSPRSIKKT